MKKAFSLIELIFVMVIIGILAATGVYYFKPNILQRDVDYVLGKIKEARFRGIGYNKFKFNGSYISDPVGCIELTKYALNNDNTKDETQKYKINDLTEISAYHDGLQVQTLCFDYLGRPHNGSQDENETNLSSLLHTSLEINVTYNGDSRTILVLPMSGFATVKVCN